MSEKALAVQAEPTRALTAFGSIQGFEDAQRMAMALCKSSLVPEDYRGQNGPANALIALEMSQRAGVSPLAVMQNLHVIQGRPSWSSSFIIASLNSCGRFSPLRFEIEDLGPKTVQVEVWEGGKGNRRKVSKKVEIDNFSCRAWAKDRDGERIDGPKVTIEMAALEGWLTKNDSKWKTMQELMLRYRAAAFFGRLYAPDILMGMHSADEVEDMPARQVQEVAPEMVTEVEPEALKPDTAEVVDAEVVTEPGTENSTGSDRNKIKAELDRLGVKYAPSTRTTTLEKLLATAQQGQATTNEEPPPLATVEDEVPPPEEAPAGNQGTAPNDLF